MAPASNMGKPVPYLTLAELKRAPIYNQLQQLTQGESEADRDAELVNILLEISAMVNSECEQNLAATTDTELCRAVVDKDGSMRIKVLGNPIVDVQSVWVGRSPVELSSSADVSGAVFGFRHFIIAGGGWRPGQRLWAKVTYVNGFPVTELTANAAAGDTEITVADVTGIVLNETILTVQGGRLAESVVPTAVSGNTLAVPALSYDHKAGVGVDALPEDIKAAMRTLVSRVHDTWSLAMGAITRDGTGAQVPGAKVTRAMCDAAWQLNRYRRRTPRPM